ncbi:hypothetical protein BD560DRAFT_404679 [Blakeslea trispora]|nr:hypothetical protein BD560DRAFT_404679 [Blakeslea trispora]
MQTAQTELDFINHFLDALSGRSVRYGQDYTTRTLPTQRIKKTPPKPVSANKEPTVVPEERSVVSESKLQVTVKVLKPSSQFIIGGFSPETTISQLKQRIYQQQSAFPVNRQRLLIKGKTLPDQKTLGELSVQEGTVIHLMATAAPANTTTAADVAATVPTGRFGISATAEQKLSSPEFWSALEATVSEQLGEADAKLVLNQIKSSLAA